MLKKDTLGNASRKSLSEAFKCGECLHFKNHPHASHKTICSQEGIKTFAVAPSCFTPDITQVVTNSDQLVAVAAIFESFSYKQRRILLGMLRGKDTNKKRLKFGTKVYFRAIGKDYISNYLAGFIAGYTSAGELIVTGSPDVKSRGKSYTAYMKDDSELLTLSEWKAKKKALQASGKVQDPSVKFKIKSAIDDYEPSTLDTRSEWLDRKPARRSSRMAPLTDTFKVT